MGVYHRTVWVKPECDDINSVDAQKQMNSLDHISLAIDTAIGMALSKIELAFHKKVELVSVFYQPVMHSNSQCYLVTVIAREIPQLPQVVWPQYDVSLAAM
jgi:hypothetical protein